MKTVCELDSCNGCMACKDKCPKHCISIEDSLKAYNAIIDDSKCINCKLCEKICPNINTVKKQVPILWRQGWAKEEISKNSSSGGIASAIIKHFIENGGYVAACLFNHGEFVFEITNSVEFARKFSGSRYVKSNPAGIYKKIQERLKTDRVLFVGLPCQVAALLNFVGVNKNLYTIDLICHGTPSPQILDKYLLEKGKNLRRIENIHFRSHSKMGILIEGKPIYGKRIVDEYLCMFLEGVGYTNNCYKCKFASSERISDLTLGDSWGTKMKNERSISLLLIQSEKGKKLIDESELQLFDVDIQNAINNNHQLSKASIKTKKTDLFFKLIKRFKLSHIAFIIVPKSVLKQRIKMVLIRLNIIS